MGVKKVKKVEIASLDEKGRGVGKINSKEIRVHFAVPGDIVEVKTYRRKGLKGRILRILKHSPLRVKPRCKHFGKCGGCRWQNIRYKEQLKIKQDVIRELFKGCRVSKIVASEEFRYRNRMDFIFWKGFKLGLREPESYDRVVDIENCLLISEKCNEIMAKVKSFVEENKISIYDFKKKRGLLRYLVLREARFTNERMAVILTSKQDFPKIKELEVDANIIWSRTSTLSDVSQGEEHEVIKGKEYITEKLLGYSFRITPSIFFQTNSKQAEEIYKTVVEFSDLSGREKVLDLYCGSGAIGIILASQARSVVGVEISKEAVEVAKINARENNIENIKFICAKAEELSTIEGDVVVVDPPRAGLHKKVIKFLKKISPKKIIYVSCNPRTQKRDIEALNYKIEEVKPIDMFPHTPHIENVVLLVRD